MTWPADYHMHTRLCRHAVGDPVDLAARAVELGFTEIGFSEHSPMPRDDFDDWRMFERELGLYVANVQEARRRFPQLTIRLALEVDYLPGHEPWIRDLAGRHPWDYLIGAVHYVSDSWALDNPHALAEWRHRDPDEVWRIYFERLTAAAASELFDIMAHADLCKKFCFYPRGDVTPLYAGFLDAAKVAGVAMELNTAGLRKDCREIYPGPLLVRMAAERGVPITFGSDAHAPGEVGLNFADAVAAARQAGHVQWRRFTGGRRSEIMPL